MMSVIGKIGLVGLLLTLALNLVGLLAFGQAAAEFFSPRWWSIWLPAYLPWFVLTVIGLAGSGGSRKACHVTERPKSASIP